MCPLDRVDLLVVGDRGWGIGGGVMGGLGGQMDGVEGVVRRIGLRMDMLIHGLTLYLTLCMDRQSRMVLYLEFIHLICHPTHHHQDHQ